MRLLALANSPLVARVDDDFSDGRNWFLATNGYVVESDTLQYLHRFVMGEPHAQIDHRDRDKLNNQRSNLRHSTQAQNIANTGPRSGRQYKGVYVRARDNRVKAAICINGKQIHLGTFSTETEAARAYNKAALRAWGEFAYLNPVD